MPHMKNIIKRQLPKMVKYYVMTVTDAKGKRVPYNQFDSLKEACVELDRQILRHRASKPMIEEKWRFA